MAKIILGKPPKEFKRPLSFAQVNGEPGTMAVNFKYRTRTEFAAFKDQLIEEQRAAGAAEMQQLAALVEKALPMPDLTQVELLAREAKANVDFVMGCLVGWDLDVPFDRAAVEQLADEVPAAILAIVGEYTAAIDQGRQGN